MKATKCRAFTLLGIGTVGSGIVQILPSFLNADTLHVLDCVEDVEAKVAKLVAEALPEARQALQRMKIVVHKVRITEENLSDVLRPLFVESQAVMDLTTCCDSEMIARLADQCDCAYINACLEVFEEKEDLTEAQRHQRFREIRGTFKNTSVLEIGMNPGLISLLLNRALRDAGFSSAEVASVHVTEFDTHILRAEHRREDCFYNTWSPFGLFEEGVKFAEVAWDGPPPAGWIPEGHLIHHQSKCGVEVSLRSVTPVWKDATDWEFQPYRGFLVTHGEVETMSTKLGKRARVAFVYHVCDDGRRSLSKWGRGHAPSYVMMRGDWMDNESAVCADNIGVFVVTRDGRGWWTGSLMQSVEAQRVAGPANNGANITVSAACLATIAWCIDHPNRGMLFPDDLSDDDSESLLQRCEPFLGKMVSKAVPSHLIPPINQDFVYSSIGQLPPV